jgi:hypothetical protein
MLPFLDYSRSVLPLLTLAFRTQFSLIPINHGIIVSITSTINAKPENFKQQFADAFQFF